MTPSRGLDTPGRTMRREGRRPLLMARRARVAPCDGVSLMSAIVSMRCGIVRARPARPSRPRRCLRPSSSSPPSSRSTCGKSRIEHQPACMFVQPWRAQARSASSSSVHRRSSPQDALGKLAMSVDIGSLSRRPRPQRQCGSARALFMHAWSLALIGPLNCHCVGTSTACLVSMHLRRVDAFVACYRRT